ncbi:MAG TPA: hypothetical protein VJL36_00765 [Candidatus Paceibacterota bacterium]
MIAKPKLFLVPAYIGPLKYYAKLIPWLSPNYEVEFLIVRSPNQRRWQMENYLRDNGYSYHIIDQGLKPARGIYLPLITPVLKRLSHLRACRRFLEIHRPAKLVLTKNLPPYRVILKEANRQGVDTIILQWAYGGNKVVSRLNFASPSWWRKLYYRLMDDLYWLIDFFVGGLAYAHSPGVVNRLGLMDEAAIEIFRDDCGISPERMIKVGMADRQFAYELKRRITRDAAFRKELERKYDLGKKGKIITVLVWGLHKRKRWNFSLEEHLDYFRMILESIRKFFPPVTAEIVFKLHPGDDATLYFPFKDAAVKVFGDEAETEELIGLADLCISDPWTAANTLVMAVGGPAFFVNFSRLTAINAGKELYRLHELIISRRGFEDSLRQFKQGIITPQYDDQHIDLHAIDKIIALIG